MNSAPLSGAGPIADAIRSAIAGCDVAPDAYFMIADAGEGVPTAIDGLRAIVRGAADAMVLIVPAALPALDRAMLLASITPLALEFAPDRRVCAIDVAQGADPAAVAEAALFLAAARCTAGQLLRIEPEARG